MKKHLVCSVISVIVMLLLPWCAVTFVPSDGGMLVSLLLLFAVNPISAVCIGIISGSNPRSLWLHPLLLSALFTVGAWKSLGITVPDRLSYAAVYLAVGYLALLLTILLRRKKDSASL